MNDISNKWDKIENAQKLQHKLLDEALNTKNKNKNQWTSNNNLYLI